MGQVTGGELVVRTLVKAGVTDAFALHGGHLESIFQACLDHDLKVVDHRDEAAAGHAAEGYARARRGLGVAMATAGPGFTNILTSVANAFNDRTPVLYITGSAPQAAEDMNQSQAGIDNVAISRPLTKWSRRITSTADIPRLVAHAIRVATSVPTGPVLLDIPFDVSLSMADEGVTDLVGAVQSAPAPAPSPGAIAETLALLAAAERPVVMVGEGAWQSGAEEELRAFVEATEIPVFAHYQSYGMIPSDHPLFGGGFYKMCDLVAPTERPDVVLAMGTRFGVYTLHPSDRVVPASATVIQVEVDPLELGRIRRVDLAIEADSRLTLMALNAALGEHSWPERKEWQVIVASTKSDREEQLKAFIGSGVDRIHPYEVAKEVVSAMDDAILVGDGAEAHQWIAEVVHPSAPGEYFTHGHFACLGMGLGFAIGVQTANPSRR